MARKNKTGKPAPAPGAGKVSSISKSWDWPKIQRGLRLAAWIVTVGALLAAWALGVPRLEAYVTQTQIEPQGQGPVEVRFASLPPWIFPDLHTQLVLTVQQQISGDVMQRGDLEAARDGLLATGWFARIHQVRRVSPVLVEISAEFAEPYAVVRDGEGDHLVDREGRLMPLSYKPGTKPRAAVILGAHFPKPYQPGRRWEGADVEAALHVYRAIEHQPWREQVTGMDLRQFNSNETVRLVTDRGTSILWGRPPGEETSGEVPAAQKIAYLQKNFGDYGHIDRGVVRELDVVGDIVVGR